MVPLVEEGWLNGEITDSIIEHYLKPLFKNTAKVTPDTLVLGCTHFPLLKSRMEHYVGKNVMVIDSATTAAAQTLTLLQQHDLLSSAPKKETLFLVTDSPERFIATANIFLGKSLDEKSVQHISV